MKLRSAFSVLCGVAVAAFVLASCSSNSSTNGASTTTVGGSSQNSAADRALAAAANLRLSDFPTGWTSAPQSSSSADTTLLAQLQGCLHANLILFQQNSPRLAQSPEFSDPNGDSVDSNVAYLSSASDAQGEMHVIQQSNFSSCLSSAANSLLQSLIHNPSSGSTLPQGASIGHVAVSAISFPSYGDRSAAFRTAVPITYNGQSLTEYLDIVAFIKGRAIVGMNFTGGGNPIGSSTEQRLTSVVLGRLSGS